MKRKLVKTLLGIVLAIVLIVALYFIYVFAAYYRLDDNLTLDVEGNASESTMDVETQYRISSSNIGFGAYSDDYSFFMDGGTESWAFSEDAVYENITGEMSNVCSLNPDIMLIQEVDVDSTRSYHVNELELVTSLLEENLSDSFNYTFAQNYDSPFLFYPLTQPHGKSKAGLMTVTNYEITSSIRRSLPIEEGFSKFYDLDRCYSKNYISLSNGSQLVVYNVHLSAYTTDPSTAENQVIMLNEDMLSEYNAGNYVIAGGDMNKDLLGDSTQYFGVASIEDNWASPFPTELLDDCFTLIGPLDEDNPIPSCRNANEAYSEDDFVLTVDGFIVSSNVEVVYANVMDAGFEYSDHNPVYMDFILH